jgi:hypothetical protein
MNGISRLTEELLAAQDGIWWVELIGWWFGYLFI